jgi:hypothetical protein
MTIRAMAFLTLLGLFVPSAACDKKSSGDSGGGAASTSSGATGANAGSKRRLKTTLTAKQLQDTYESTIKGNNAFAKHGELVTAKLGKPAKVEGDKSSWYGYKAPEGAMPDDCVVLFTSATQGSGTMAVNGVGNCWE